MLYGRLIAEAVYDYETKYAIDDHISLFKDGIVIIVYIDGIRVGTLSQTRQDICYKLPRIVIKQINSWAKKYCQTKKVKRFEEKA